MARTKIETIVMSDEAKLSVAVEDLISSGEDTLGSSISLSLGESSVRLIDKCKPAIEQLNPNDNDRNKNDVKKWWLKRPETRLEIPTTTKNCLLKKEGKKTCSSDVSSSMKEFLEKEKFCKAQHNSQVEEKKDKDDTLCDILASAAFDKYPSDFENATDEDIGSFLEEMSKIAGALSPSSAPERTKSSDNSSKNRTEEEKSVEELLEEAERLVRENVGLSKSGSRSDTLVPDEAKNFDDNSRGKTLEEEIFHLIEQEVHRESEKIRKSPKNEKKRREPSPGFEILYENINSLKAPISTNFETERKRFEDEKVEVSSSSDIDDPIDRHSKSEDTKKITDDTTQMDKENLQKEITDVDKDFFDDLLRRSKEKMEGGMSGSSSFGQEDFSHFLRILQGQDRKEQQCKSLKMCPNEKKREMVVEQNVVFPEKEITAILEKELPGKNKIINDSNGEKHRHEFGESDSSVTSVEINENNRKNGESLKIWRKKRSHSDDRQCSGGKGNVITRSLSVEESKISGRKSSKSEDAKKVVNSKGELYTVGLTPRLELFADAIPKLIAEKSNENFRKREIDGTTKNDEGETKKTVGDDEKSHNEMEDDKKCSEIKLIDESPSKIDKNKSNRGIIDKSSPERSTRRKLKNPKLGPSKSYDQLSKPILNARSSLDDVRSQKSGDLSCRPYQYSGKSSQCSKIGDNRMAKSSLSKQMPKTKLSLKPSTSKYNILPKCSVKSEIPIKYRQAGGDCRINLTKDDLESICREEKRKNALLNEQLNSEAKFYKQQMENMRTSFEEELFGLKKENIILKGKIDELSLNDRRVEISSISTTTETRIKLLERELEKQEAMINAYETENKRLIAEIKKIREDSKITENKEKMNSKMNETEILNDKIKDLEEEMLKLNIEITNLREKNKDAVLKIEDAAEQESLLKEELEMFKDQLKTKNDFINARLQSITAAELESRKKTEDLKIELGSKTEQLKNIKTEYEKLERAVLPLEKELLELRVKDGCTTEKLEIARSHVDREKQLTLKLKDQVILDNKKILDLNRQVRDMERILKRKNPDSVSALILTAKSDNEKINLEKVKLLEDRVASLEGEIRAKEQIGQEKVTDLQNKFADMKEKYVAQVMELETKLMEATVTDRKMCNDMFTQTATKIMDNKSVEAGNSRERSYSVQFEKEDRKEQKNIKIGPKSQNPKEDAHLIATIRGLKLEIVNKDKAFGKMSKDFQELQKTNRRLQKEREKLLNDRRNVKSSEIEKNGRPVSGCSDTRIGGSKNSETNDQNSNVYQNGHFTNQNGRGLSASVSRLYDPLRYSENGETAIVNKLSNENEILKEELTKINKDFMTLKNKRLHDLNLLQEEHEREMATLLKEYSVKFGDSKVVKLQGQINTQVAIISHLKQQIEKLRDYKEQVIVLKVEREHLENKVKILNEKVKYLSTPGTEQLQLLQDKITILQQRHESREITLQSLVRDLLRNRMQCRDCKGEKGKSTKQLCYFRQELDNILGMLQEISNVQ